MLRQMQAEREPPLYDQRIRKAPCLNADQSHRQRASAQTATERASSLYPAFLKNEGLGRVSDFFQEKEETPENVVFSRVWCSSGDSLFCGKATGRQICHRHICLDSPFESPLIQKQSIPKGMLCFWCSSGDSNPGHPA